MLSKAFAAGFACLLTLATQNGSAGAAGDRAAGKVLFEGQGGCLQCHAIQNQGGSLGPDLSEIGVRRSPVVEPQFPPAPCLDRRQCSTVISP